MDKTGTGITDTLPTEGDGHTASAAIEAWLAARRERPAPDEAAFADVLFRLREAIAKIGRSDLVANDRAVRDAFETIAVTDGMEEMSEALDRLQTAVVDGARRSARAQGWTLPPARRPARTHLKL